MNKIIRYITRYVWVRKVEYYKVRASKCVCDIERSVWVDKCVNEYKKIIK